MAEHTGSMNSTESTESDAEPFCPAFATFCDLVARAIVSHCLGVKVWQEVMRSAYRRIVFSLNSLLLGFSMLS